MQFNNSEVCRTCLCLADNENVRLYSLCVVDNNNIDLKQKLKACIPELTMVGADSFGSLELIILLRYHSRSSL